MCTLEVMLLNFYKIRIPQDFCLPALQPAGLPALQPAGLPACCKTHQQQAYSSSIELVDIQVLSQRCILDFIHFLFRSIAKNATLQHMDLNYACTSYLHNNIWYLSTSYSYIQCIQYITIAIYYAVAIQLYMQL